MNKFLTILVTCFSFLTAQPIFAQPSHGLFINIRNLTGENLKFTPPADIELKPSESTITPGVNTRPIKIHPTKHQHVFFLMQDGQPIARLILTPEKSKRVLENSEKPAIICLVPLVDNGAVDAKHPQYQYELGLSLYPSMTEHNFLLPDNHPRCTVWDQTANATLLVEVKTKRN
jgi:hypothetical protein